MFKNNKFLLTFGIILLALTLGLSGLLISTPYEAWAQETYLTPTPNAQGSIYYEVQEGDNCIGISFKTGLEVAEIISLNGLGQDCLINPGQLLLIGSGEPSTTVQETPITVTEEPEPEPTAEASEQTGFARICVVLFHDMDGNGRRSEGENYLYGGEVSIADRLGGVSLTGTTVAGDPELIEPRCFDDIPAGNYNVSIAIPDDFNATTVTNYLLEVFAGEEATIDFGAQEASSNLEEVPADTTRRSPLLGIIGLVILLAGAGLSFYVWRSHKA